MESSHRKWFPMALLLSLLIVFPMVLGQNTAEANLVGVKAGDWVKYDVFCAGEPFLWDSPLLYYDPVEVDWVKVEVLSVSGSNVTVRETVHCFDGRERNSTFAISPHQKMTFGGSGYIIPANYSPGDTVGFAHIWVTYGDWRDVELTLNDTVSRSYGGVTKEVNVVQWSHLYPYDVYIYNFSYEFCWDKNTGFLLEKTFQTYALSYGNASKSTVKLEIVDTNMWEMETVQPFWSQSWMWAVVGLVGTTAAGAAVIAKMSKKEKQSKSE